MVIVLVLPALGSAAGIYVQSGTSLLLDSGTIDMGCGDVTIAGNLNIQSGAIINTRHFNISAGSVDAGNGQVELSGNWSNSGTFIPGSSQVTVQDGCATTNSTMSGDSDFYAFSAVSSNGKLLQVDAGTSQVFGNSLTLQGVIGDPLLIRSSSAGSLAFFSLDLASTHNIFAVDVRDNNALSGQLLAPGFPADYESIDSGDNSNWFLDLFEYVPVPTLSPWALLVLIMVLMTTAFVRRRAVFGLRE